MQGIWLEDGTISLRDDLGPPEPVAGEALVRVLCAGVCNTDLELVRGYYPFTGVLGHEFVGEVAAGPPELVGKRVVGEINATCGRCKACQSGRSSHCPNRTVLGIVGRNGAFAEYLTLPIENLHGYREGKRRVVRIWQDVDRRDEIQKRPDTGMARGFGCGLSSSGASAHLWEPVQESKSSPREPRQAAAAI